MVAVNCPFDDASRFRCSSSAGAYLGLTPRRDESGETPRAERSEGSRLPDEPDESDT